MEAAIYIALALVVGYLFIVPLVTTGTLVVQSVRLWWARRWFRRFRR